ncbi:hypothetical protein BD324DRAFT_607444 [Kockovaella imperatae]|uniref:Uncharacterized protein n=1 Tax=Kockovaella imperatae TaxID=4999 RepID=A0A1Y1ULQ9_9TREE|nr:hypothetical protein BD324DRAFT_607444 [Kockovaella imperatae]ORX38981.1 hypothetical protein BD324DRAFT_607444 [Kockovaella imperatae]
MKFPTSPLLLGLALSSSTLAYPAPPGARSPNPENSPLLGGDKDERGWGVNERAPSKLARGWTKRQDPSATPSDASTIGTQSLGSTLGDLTNTIGGITAGTPLGGIVNPLLGTVNGVVGGLLGDGSKGPVSSLLGGLGLGGLLDTVKGTVGGLPVAGPLLSGLLNNLNAVPVPGQGLSLVANLGNGKYLTSAGTVMQMGQGALSGLSNSAGVASATGGAVNSVLAQLPTSVTDPSSGTTSVPINTSQGTISLPLSVLQGLLGSLHGQLGNTAGSYAAASAADPNSMTAQDFSGATSAVSGLTSIPINTAQGVIHLPLSVLQGLLGNVQSQTGNPTTMIGGTAGNLVNIGGQLVPLSQVLGLLAGATSGSTAYNLADLNTGSDPEWAQSYGMDADNSTMATNSSSSSDPSASSTYSNPYPSVDQSGTPSATQLVESMIARQLPVDTRKSIKDVPIPSHSSVLPSAVRGFTSLLPSATSVLPDITTVAKSLPTPSAAERQPLTAEDFEDDDGYSDGDEDDAESWGDFEDGN